MTLSQYNSATTWQRIKRGRYSLLLLCAISTLGATGLITGCEKITNDPMDASLPANIEGWEAKLGDSLNELSEEDRLLLSRYMIRMKLSHAYDTGAIPRVSIRDALKHQRTYEQRNPNNPMGLKAAESCISLDKPLYNTYPLHLLPIDESNVIDSSNLLLKIVLSNRGESNIKSFAGKIALQSENCDKTLIIDATNVSFEPSIAPNQTGKISIPTKIDNFTVIRAIKNPQSISVYLQSGVITFTDDSQLIIE